MALASHSLTSTCGAYTRSVWLLPTASDVPPAKSSTLYLLLDAELYLNGVQAAPIVTELMATRAIPAGPCVFVSHATSVDRHADYVCNDRFARFIATDVVSWAKSRFPTLCPGDHVVFGLSLSGLAAAYIALHWPQVFNRCLSQSGSFWWLAQNDIALPTTTARCWLSVGDEETATGLTHPPSGLRQEVSQIAGVEYAAQRLTTLGATVHYHLFHGSHAAIPWRDELAPALTWLMASA